MKIKSHQPKIVVVGSCSIDLVLNVGEKPIIGETFMATESHSFIGGKGANEAVAVSRLSADTYFVGCVGMDPMGQQIMHHLVDENVNVGYVAETAKEPTGSAYVFSANGENTIVIDSGANNQLSPKYISRADKHFQSADFILVQLETPMESVEYTVNLAKKYNKKIGLYASPGQKVSSEILSKVDFIVVKERGVELVFGEPCTEDLLKKYPNKLFVRECNETRFFDGKEVKIYNDDDIEITHKMGIGDAFIAGFTIALWHGNTMDEAVIFGNKVAAKVSQEKGSQKGLPFLKDIK